MGHVPTICDVQYNDSAKHTMDKKTKKVHTMPAHPYTFFLVIIF